MERKHFENEPKAETPLPDVRRATSMPAWIGAGLAMKLPGKMPDVVKRYSLALVLAGLALYIRGALDFAARHLRLSAAHRGSAS